MNVDWYETLVGDKLYLFWTILGLLVLFAIVIIFSLFHVNSRRRELNHLTKMMNNKKATPTATFSVISTVSGERISTSKKKKRR